MPRFAGPSMGQIGEICREKADFLPYLFPIMNQVTWGFSASENSVYSKRTENGLQDKNIFINIPSPNDVKDLAILAENLFLLQNSTLWRVNLFKENLNKYDLKLNTYYGIIALFPDIIVLGNSSLKFNTSSKLCRKINLDLIDLNVIAKCVSGNELFLVVNVSLRDTNTCLYRYVGKTNRVVVVYAKCRIPLLCCAAAFVYEKNLIVFGGRYDQGWSSKEVMEIDLESMEVRSEQVLLTFGSFNRTIAIMDSDRVSALDTQKNLHVFNFHTKKWKLMSEKAWSKRKTVLWLWKLSQTQPINTKLYKLPVSLIRKLLQEYCN